MSSLLKVLTTHAHNCILVWRTPFSTVVSVLWLICFSNPVTRRSFAPTIMALYEPKMSFQQILQGSLGQHSSNKGEELLDISGRNSSIVLSHLGRECAAVAGMIHYVLGYFTHYQWTCGF